MDKLTLELDWDIPPKNGLNEFISPELYVQHSVTYKLLRENVYNYYAKFLKKDEGNLIEEHCSERDTEAPKQKPTSSRNNKKEGRGRTDAGDKKISSLTAKEQKKYLYLFQKYSNKVISAPSEIERKAIDTLAALHKKVVSEQRKFAEYQKSNAKFCIEYNFIHPEAARYVKELVQKKLQSCLFYPRHYITKQKLSLLEDVKIDSSALPSLVCNLLELGRVPRLVSPDLENCSIQCNYTKMCKRFPFIYSQGTSESHPSKQPVSQDSIAKILADKHSADVILSFSSLKHLLNCRSLNSATSWELPVTVTSVPSIDATNCYAKRVFIDKVIPAGSWLPSRKNALYHKYGVKLQFTHFKPSKVKKKAQSLHQGTSEEKQPNREIVKLQDGVFETENFLHETFGQISCSPEKVSISDVCVKSEVRTFDIINKSTGDTSMQNKHDNKRQTSVSHDDNLYISVHKETEAELDKTKSDLSSNFIKKKNELAVKDIKATDEASTESPVEKHFDEISSAASFQCNKDNINVKVVNSSESSTYFSLEQNKKDSPINKEQKTLDESALEESPKSKKRKIRLEPSAFPERRLTRSQTKKLEDTVKQLNSSKLHDTKQKSSKNNEIIRIRQNLDFEPETIAQSSVKQNKHIAQHSEIDAEMTEEVETLSTAKENDLSNDSFPRVIPKRVKVLSTDDSDSDDNLVIDENVLTTDDKQKSVNKNPDSTGANADTGINRLNNEEPFCNNMSQPQNERINIPTTSNNIINPENTQVLAIDKAMAENNKLFSEDKKDIGSTLDQILHLQEEMLKPKHKCVNSSVEQTPQILSSPQPGLPTYLEDASQFPPLDPSLNINTLYSLWNMGQFKIIMRSKLDSRHCTSRPCFIFSKLEYQSQFGGEICSEQELLSQWITLLCHPGSIGLRVRIDARTSKVLMTEHLTLNNVHNLVTKLSPEKPLCWIIDIFEKLKGLPNGQYLLGYQKKEDILTLYAAADENKRGDFDLHTAIRQRLVALYDDNTGWQQLDSEREVPWLPIDPDIMLPSLISRNRIPATFPPAKGNDTMPRKRKTSKKKSKKKKTMKEKAWN